MTRVFLLCIAFAIVGFSQIATVQAQSGAEGRRFSLLNTTLSIAGSGEILRATELNLADEQKVKLEEFAKRYKAVMDEFNRLRVAEKSAAIPRLNKTLLVLESELTNQILRPRQAKILRAKVFSRNVRQWGGSVFEAIINNHVDQFEFSEDQTTRLRDVDTKAKEKIAAARKRFKLEVEAITKDAQAEMESFFTPKQKAMLDELQGKSDESND